MTKFKIEILLPIYHNTDEYDNRKRIDGNEYSETYQDLMKQFKDCSHIPTPISGGWINPDTGEEVTDELTVYWVVYDDTEENLEFLQNFREVLKKRFKQDEIMMYSVTVTTF